MKKLISLMMTTLIIFTNIGMASSKNLVKYKTIILDQYKIIALDDGVVDVPLAAYKGDKNYQKIEDSILKKNHINVKGTKSLLVSLNAYLIQYQNKNILVDTGSGGLLPPEGHNGFMLKSLEKAGIKPSQINAILITHLHPDHIGGLVTKSGTKVFQNATIYINQADWQFWHNKNNVKKLAPFERSWFNIVTKELSPYKGQVYLYSPYKQKLLANIYAIPLPGHTPGHTGYLLKTKNKSLLIWGDIVHIGLFDFLYPNWSMIFDINRKLAVKQHYYAMDWAAKDDLLIAGMHLPFPGIGIVTKKGRSFHYESIRT